MKEIPLTRGLVALVDDEDYSEPVQFKWYAKKSKRTFYAERSTRIDGHKRNVLMHRVITDYPLTDHIDGNGLNNQRSNLRPATYQQNAWNRGIKSGSTSRYLGVHWDSSRRKWVASMSHNYKVYQLGRYTTEVEAARAYDAAALARDPEFARLNFPREYAA